MNEMLGGKEKNVLEYKMLKRQIHTHTMMIEWERYGTACTYTILYTKERTAIQKWCV